MFRKSAFFVLLSFGFISNVYSESCDFLPRAMQPDWTSDSPAIEGYYVGVGLAEAEDLSANEQVEQARQSAVGELANSISVSVRSSLSVDVQESSSFFGGADVEKNVRQLTETIAETSLKDVEVDSKWLDRKRCIVWVRVKVSRTIVDKMERREINTAKLNKLDLHYDQAKDKSISAEERDSALKQAYVLLDEIDFSVLQG